MRMDDAMRPARSWEEAAMMTAQARTISGGAALRALKAQQIERDIQTLDVQNTAIKEAPAAPRQEADSSLAARHRRAALNQVLRGMF